MGHTRFCTKTSRQSTSTSVEMSSEKFCLKWNEFQSSVISSYQDLRKEQELTDVTLACEDNLTIEAHKVILSHASNFFCSVFSGNKHSHPLIYMRGVKVEYLESVLDFIYYGEVNIYQNDLSEFLKLAEDLGLKGLKSDNIECQEDSPEIEVNLKSHNLTIGNPVKLESEPALEEYKTDGDIDESQTVSIMEMAYIPEAKLNASFKDENNRYSYGVINSMLKRVDGLWSCTECGKTNKDKTKVKSHIETHIEGMSHKCGYCGKSLGTRNSLHVHLYRTHRQSNKNF